MQLAFVNATSNKERPGLRTAAKLWFDAAPDSSIPGVSMSALTRWAVLLGMVLVACGAMSQTNTPNNPTWWNKYQYLSTHSPNGNAGTSKPASVGANVDVSNECGPQSETFITVNTSKAKNLAG